ncbi:baseplate J/gp47 family protein [Levilactobacillus brevis]|uniref:Baseplate J/gp47 family protein n=1 Tax=Levilactobacillus brevis TaxID=1580 RepID=A0AA41ERH9_LEVBR|nr:baseplate J/gp47 family protein [Levilactobacillus brevis]MBS0948452.1 baseplate J/gp47 family protein [Levilactobacillus brevis]MBS1011551.1 baseplate J/gp47 family protein [Levilactobacillus brevis]
MPLTTDTGFDRKELDDLRDDINALFIKRFGDGIDLDDSQTPGMLAGVLSETDDTLEKLAQGVYNSFFVLKSSGANLDDLAAELEVYRKPAVNAYVELQIDGYVDPDSPTIIPEETQFSTPDGQVFSTMADTTITQQATYVDSGGNTQPLEDDDGNALGRQLVQAVAIETGTASNVMPNTIINPEDSIDGFYAVTNPSAATGGGDSETDDELRQRVLANRLNTPNSTPDGIQTAIKNLSGVTDVRLINNNTMSTDSYGNPAKSVHLYVIGGADADIIQTYFDYLPPQSNTVGSVMGTATDIGGRQYIVAFDRAETVPVFIKVGIHIDDTKFDTDNGPANIKTNIINYFDTLGMGDKVLYSKLFAPSYSPVGVTDVALTLGTSLDKLTEADVSVSDFQLAVTNSTNITVNIIE